MSQNIVKAATWFWVVAVLALVWNLIGVMAFVSQVTMGQEELEALSEAQRTFVQITPGWVTLAYGVAVFAGALGCVAFFMKKSWATMLFVISLAGILAQNVYGFFISNAVEIYGAEATALPIVVIVVGIALIWLSRSAKRKGWIL